MLSQNDNEKKSDKIQNNNSSLTLQRVETSRQPSSIHIKEGQESARKNET